MPHALDSKRALNLIMEMLPLPGRSGHEGEIMRFIQKKLRAAGVPASAINMDDANKRSPIGGDVGNLICRLPGTIKAPRRLLMAHVDTVPLCAGADPVRNNGFIRSKNPATGLGGDNRSGAAAILNAALEIIRRKLPHPPLTFFWPIQEEIGLMGARFVKVPMLGNPKLCFNWDGGKPGRITIGATGAYRMSIEVTGLASHAGGAPEKGVSAIAIAGLAIAELQGKGWHGLIKKGSKRGTSNIGVINGGEATNVVTDRVTLRAEARSHDPKFRKQIVAAFRSAFTNAVKRVKSAQGATGKVRFDAELHYESFKLSSREQVVSEAGRVVKSLGLDSELHISNGGLDANWLTRHGLPTVTLGAGQQAVHTVNERLIVDEFLDGCRVALNVACGNCK